MVCSVGVPAEIAFAGECAARAMRSPTVQVAFAGECVGTDRRFANANSGSQATRAKARGVQRAAGKRARPRSFADRPSGDATQQNHSCFRSCYFSAQCYASDTAGQPVEFVTVAPC